MSEIPKTRSFSRVEMLAQLAEIRARGKFLSDTKSPLKVVFTNGCFDLLHVGHVRYLQQARSLGDILVVGLNSDRSVRELKGKSRPIQNEQDRAEILLGLKAVDLVSIFDESTPENLIQAVRPDVLVKGGDWPVEKIVGSSFVQSYGGEVRSLQFVMDHSTSQIIDRLRQK